MIAPAYNPAAIEGTDFFIRISYGDTASAAEKMERYLVVKRLLDCHKELVDLAEPGHHTMMVVNDACGDMLVAIGHVLYLDPYEAQMRLLDQPELVRDLRIWDYVQKARP